MAVCSTRLDPFVDFYCSGRLLSARLWAQLVSGSDHQVSSFCFSQRSSVGCAVSCDCVATWNYVSNMFDIIASLRLGKHLCETELQTKNYNLKQLDVSVLKIQVSKVKLKHVGHVTSDRQTASCVVQLQASSYVTTNDPKEKCNNNSISF